MKKHPHIDKSIKVMALLSPIAALVFSACSSLPALLELKPNTYEDSNVKIEYRIGTRVHYIKITNNTETEMFLDSTRSSIVSIRNETRSLNLSADDTHIPPFSSLVLTSGVVTFFGTDIDWPFRDRRSRDHYQTTEYISYMDEREYLSHYAGQSIRLFLPLIIRGKEEIYDVRLAIDGVKN